MAYTEKSAVAEIASFIFIRIACIFICLLFFMPMFKISISSNFYYSNLRAVEKITGIQSILGVRGTTINGNPFALAAFIYPMIIVMLSFIDLFYENFYKVSLIAGIAGLLLNIIYFASETSYLVGNSGIFYSSLYQIKTSLSSGCFFIVLVYLVIIVFSLILGKVHKTD